MINVDSDKKMKPRDFRMGVWLGQLLPWEATVETVKLIEEFGFYSFFVTDEFVQPYDYSIPWYEAWTTLAGIGALTERIRLGALVTCIIYRNPALTAKEIMTVDHITNGRVEIAIGSGYKNSAGHFMTGVEAWEPKERVNRFEEFIQIIDLMLTQEMTNFNGKYYKVKDSYMVPSTVQKPRPPLTIGAHGQRMLKITAKYADSWNSFLSPSIPVNEGYKLTLERNQFIDEQADKFGRDPDKITRSFTLGWTQEDIFASMQAFEDYIYGFWEVGINEFIIGYMPHKYFLKYDPPPIKILTDRDMLESIAYECIPKLQQELKR